MPNPNVSELRLWGLYGENPSAAVVDGQNTHIEYAFSTDSDEIDHKFVYGVPIGGTYVELAHYVSVKQVVLQNISAFGGSTFYVDNTTGDLVPGLVPSGEHVSFCDPDVTAGIMLYSFLGGVPPVLQPTEWHIAICGRKD